MAVNTVPEGYHSLTPFLTVGDVEAAVRFYSEAFEATTAIRRDDKGRLLLADLLIGGSHLVISDRSNAPGETRSGNAMTLRLYVADATKAFARAIAAGATETSPLQDMYWGDRVGELTDPFGFPWKISQHLADIDHQEIERRMHEALA